MLVLTINGLLGRTKRGGYNPPPVKLDPVIPPPDPDPDPDPDPPEELPPEVLPNPATGTPLFTATFENADTVPTWEGQPFHFGQEWVKGEVPAGNYVRPEINGVLIPAQLSERVTWNDGSLKFAQVSVNVPSIPAGGSLTVTWKRFTGSWTTMDEVTHTSPKSVTDHVNLEYVFSSWKGKDASNILTEEKGPKTFLSSRLLGPSNSEWVETYGAGRVCTEWKATDYALLPNGDKDPNFACMLYARAWNGTAGNPRYIQFLFRTMYGWSDDGIPTSEAGFVADINLKVNDTVIRGALAGTPLWGQRQGFKGGFFASAGATGQMDWYDVLEAKWVTPPRLVYRRNILHAINSKLIPPYDTANPLYTNPNPIVYEPQTRAGLTQNQGDTGDNGNIPWATSTVFARSILAHAGKPVDHIVRQDQTTRVTAFGLAAEGGMGFNRATRKIVCYLPPEKNPDPVALGASVWTGAKPTHLSPTQRGLNPYMTGQDGAHWPQIVYGAYFLEGEQYLLDMLYHEATLPGVFSSNAYGFFGTIRGVRFGGISFYGQIRMAGQGVRPILNAVALGKPTDPHWKLCNALLTCWLDTDEKVAEDEDLWRGSTTQQAYNVYRMNNEPTYKLWMHSFALFALSMGYGGTENARVKARADWWAKLFTIMGGGYRDDDNYLMKPDPVSINGYYTVCSLLGGGSTTVNRRVWHPGQWAFPTAVTYLTDNQTLQFSTSVENGQVITPAGQFQTGGDPPFVVDIKKVPVGLSPGTPYYAVQSSGNTCKLALTPGGSPITFDVAGVELVASAAKAHVNGVTSGTPIGASVCPTPIHYFNQNKGALDVYQHFCAPSDLRVLLARQQLKAYKDADPNNSGYDVKAKFTVPH